MKKIADTTANHEERVLFVNNEDAVVEGFTVTGGRLCALAAAGLTIMVR